MTDRKQMQGPAIAAIAGSVVVVIGTLMTWITVSGGFLLLDRSGVNYDADAKFMIGLAVIAALAATSELADVKILPGNSSYPWTVIIDGGIVGLLGINAAVQLHDKVKQVTSVPGVQAHVGAGVWVSVAGAVLVLSGGVRMLQAKRQGERGDVDEVRARLDQPLRSERI